MVIQHYKAVSHEDIEAKFTSDKKHRSYLFVPFLNRNNDRLLHVIGQNPSDANEVHADKTLHYLEKLIFDNHPEYSGIVMLNLYSRIDTNKTNTEDLDRPETIETFRNAIAFSTDVLFVTGASAKDGAFEFSKKIEEIKPLLNGRSIYRINTGSNTSYPPHPGNPKILYNKYTLRLERYDL